MPLYRLREKQKNRSLRNIHGQIVDVIAGDVIELTEQQAAGLVNIVQRLPDPDALVPKVARDGQPLVQQPPEGDVPNQIAIAPGEVKGTGPDKTSTDPNAAKVTHVAKPGEAAKPVAASAAPAAAAKPAVPVPPAAAAKPAVPVPPVKPAAVAPVVPVDNDVPTVVENQ